MAQSLIKTKGHFWFHYSQVGIPSQRTDNAALPTLARQVGIETPTNRLYAALPTRALILIIGKNLSS